MIGPNVKVLFGTPTYSGQVHAAYVMSLLGSFAHLGEQRVPHAATFLRGSLQP